MLRQYYFLILILTVSAQTVTDREESDKMHTQSGGTGIKGLLEGNEWFVNRLKDIDFGVKQCEEETFQDQVQSYRKSLREDAAKVDFVGAEPLPVAEEDLHVTNKVCPVDPTKSSTKSINLFQFETNTTISAKDGTLGIATPNANVKQKIDKVEDSRKRSEYRFSSVEYYDDVPDFTDSMCPDAVDVITLEIDHLRGYTVECETITKWVGLHSDEPYDE